MKSKFLLILVFICNVCFSQIESINKTEIIKTDTGFEFLRNGQPYYVNGAGGTDYLELLNAKHRDTLDTLKAGKLTDEVIDTLSAVAKDVSAKYN